MSRILDRIALGVALSAPAVCGGCGGKSAEEENTGAAAESGKPAYAGWPLSYWQPKLADKDAAIRADAAKAVGRMRSEGKAAVPDLIKLLDDENVGVRTAAAYALGRIGPDAAAAVPALTKSLPHFDDNLRAGAAAALGGIGPQAKPAIPELTKLLSAEGRARAAAVYGLWAIGPDGVAALQQAAAGTLSQSAAVALALKATGSNVAAVLAKAVEEQSGDEEVRQYPALALAGKAEAAAAALPALQKALDSKTFARGQPTLYEELVWFFKDHLTDNFARVAKPQTKGTDMRRLKQ